MGPGTPTNITMMGPDQYSYNITVPSNSTESLRYIFHANDTSNHWGQTHQRNVSVIDNDEPVFGTDGSDTSGTTGETFSFSIAVSDNIDVDGIYVEYWFNSGKPTNVSMSTSIPYTLNVPIYNESQILNYIFHATDAADNWNQTTLKNISIFDNDSPVFGTDESDRSGTTGDIFSFSIGVTDNIVVTGVYVEYWFGNGSQTNVSMSGTGPYTHFISVPSGSVDVLHYIFHATDSGGNWMETSQTDATLVDNDSPVFRTDSSDTSMTTGESFSFNISVTDNIGVTGVYIEYWLWSGSPINVSMSGMGSYTYSISIPSISTDTLHYIFHATDLAGNWVNTSQVDITVKDNDAPIFGIDGSDSSGTTGDTFSFSIAITDNIGVFGVNVDYWFESGPHSNASMSGTGPYTYSISVPSGSTDTLYYIFQATDFAGNWIHTSQVDITVRDNDAPIFGTDGSDSSGTTGDTFSFNIAITDNIDVSGVYLVYWFRSGSQTNVSISGTGPYTYSISVPSGSTDTLHYIFHASDSGGNWGKTSQTDITIKDNDAPVFGTDGSDSSGTTGETFSFSIFVTDNTGVTEVFVEYWYGTESKTNVSMFGNGPYTYSISIPTGSTDTLHYIFLATDSGGNWEESSQVDLNITENNPIEGWIFGIISVCIIILLLMIGLIIISHRKRQGVEE